MPTTCREARDGAEACRRPPRLGGGARRWRPLESQRGLRAGEGAQPCSCHASRTPRACLVPRCCRERWMSSQFYVVQSAQRLLREVDDGLSTDDASMMGVTGLDSCALLLSTKSLREEGFVMAAWDEERRNRCYGGHREGQKGARASFRLRERPGFTTIAVGCIVGSGGKLAGPRSRRCLPPSITGAFFRPVPTNIRTRRTPRTHATEGSSTTEREANGPTNAIGRRLNCL